MIFGKNSRKLEELSGSVAELSGSMEELSRNVEAALQKSGREKWENIKSEVSQSQENLKSEASRIREELSGRFDGLEKQIRRQSASFEDLLEEMQEWQSGKEQERQRQAAADRRQAALLSLILLERSQFLGVCRAIRNIPALSDEERKAWEQQLGLMEQASARAMSRCGLEETGKPGERVDYELMDVLKTVGTDDEALDDTVAEVYERGMLFQGTVLKKAQTAVYHFARC